MIKFLKPFPYMGKTFKKGKILDLGIEVYAERGAEAPEAGSDVKVLDWQIAVLVGGKSV